MRIGRLVGAVMVVAVTALVSSCREPSGSQPPPQTPPVSVPRSPQVGPRYSREPYGQWRESVRRGRPDCNGNGVADSLDISLGILHDRNGNQVPDECESLGKFSDEPTWQDLEGVFHGQLDCNNNGVADSLDIVRGILHDKNANNYPDECEPDSLRNQPRKP